MTIHTVEGLEIDEWVARAEAAEACVSLLEAALSLQPNTQAFLKQTKLREAAEAEVARLREALESKDALLHAAIGIGPENPGWNAALADKEGEA